MPVTTDKYLGRLVMIVPSEKFPQGKPATIVFSFAVKGEPGKKPSMMHGVIFSVEEANKVLAAPDGVQAADAVVRGDECIAIDEETD